MLNFKVIGCGAAGNKACIDLINSGFNKEKIVLLNSTSRDIPAEYKEEAILFGEGLGGCGKERRIGKKMILQDMQENNIDLDRFVDPNEQAIILVGSTEGGSGSATIPVLAKYFKEVHGCNVICVLFFGFQSDTRGLQNSVELCQELSEDYGVVAISNLKFLNQAGDDEFKAEKLANEYFVNFIKTIAGLTILPGSQVIDDTDLFKVVTTPGYMMSDGFTIQKLKDTDEFDNKLKSCLTHHCFIDPPQNPGMKREALIFTVPDNAPINYRCAAIEEMYGTPYERFVNKASSDDNTVKFQFIISGMKLPVTELIEIYESYKERTQKVDKSSDSFLDVVGDMKGAVADSQFDVMGKQSTKISKGSFFKSFNMDAPEKPVQKKSGKKNEVTNIPPSDEY